MLRKLMKYEFKATGRIILPLYAAFLIFAFLTRFLFFYNTMTKASISSAPNLIALISIFAYGFLMAAIFVVTLFIIIQRFYKNLLCDEGYLMNTLPVETYKNIANKLIVGVLWTILGFIIVMISFLVLFITFDSFKHFIINFIHEAIRTFDKYGFTPYLALFEFLILSLLGTSKFIIKIFASICIGHLFDKAKVLWSLGIFIVLSIAESIIDLSLLNSNLTIRTAELFTNKILLIPIVYFAIYNTVYFFIANYIVKNKLNLE